MRKDTPSRTRGLVLSASAFLLAWTAPAAPETAAYKTLDSGRKLSLRMHAPAGKPALGVLLFHGGGWRNGSAEMLDLPCRRLAERGVLAASAEYRLLDGGGADTPLDCVEDAADAAAAFKALAAEKAGGPIPIAIGGGSAGAHLALCVALGLGPAGSGSAPPPDVAALLLYNPVLDIGPDGWKTGHATMGARWRELSPVDHLRPGMPPALVCHGTEDDTTPFANAERFHRESTALGNVCELRAFPGQSHILWNPARGGANFEKCHAATIEFLRARKLLPPVEEAGRME